MKTMTIRNIPDNVAELLKQMSATATASMNATVVQVLSERVLPRRRAKVQNDFSKYCGTWTQKEFDDFEESVADCEVINPEDWK